MTFRLLLIDMDSTLINEEAIDLLAELSGVGEQVAAITERAMAGELDFHSALRSRVALLADQETSIFDRVRQKLTFTAGLDDLFRGLKSKGIRIGVVSGGFHEIIDPLLQGLDLDFVRANRFDISSGRLSGQVLDPIIGAEEKAGALKDFAEKYSIPLDRTIAVGDGANDREMLKLAGLGISFCGKAALQEVAEVSIEKRDLSLILDYIE